MQRRTKIPLLVAALLSFGCSTDRTIVEEGDDPEMVGEQPVAPGAMYSPCTNSNECPDGLCVFPSGEAGYCSAPCTAPTDPGNCAPPPGDQMTTCFDVGLPDGSWVCALDCEDIGCPTGMRCEQVQAADGERAICF